VAVSLRTFLQTGTLGEDWIGKSAAEVVALLGEPDAKGGTSNKYPHPNIYLYGIVELNFSRTAPNLCTSLSVDYEKSATFQFSQNATITDWPWTSATTREEAKAYLQEHALFDTPVRLVFDDDTLAALYMDLT
jgi:hypothetical protein